MARKYRTETIQVPIGRGFGWYVKWAIIILLAIIIIAAVI